MFPPRSSRGHTLLYRAGPMLCLVGQRRDGYDFDNDVGLSKRRNSDHLGRRRVVIAAVLRAMLGKELVHHVQAKIGRAQNAAIGKWPLTKMVSLMR